MAENPILNDRYRLIEQIGSGGMAVIYKGQDLELGRMVAVKVLRPSLVGDPEFLMRFKREAQAAANLSHPNIVTVHDVGQDGPKTHYIVMEYVGGQDLKKVIRARKEPFEVDAALAIIIEVCKAVGYAHRAGLVHCDVKPQNILITPDNSIKVTDFGIARALSAAQPDTEDMVWGSPHYFSPEQAMGEPPTPASDVYSIGVVMFELLTGKLPFSGLDHRELALAHVSKDAPSILDIDPLLPPELDRVVRKLLAKEPSARYRTADQLGRILDKYRRQGQQPTASFVIKPSSATTPPPPQQQPAQRAAPRPAPGLTPPQAPPTVPSLPPIDMQAVTGRPSPQPVAPPPTTYAEEEEYEYDLVDDFLPGVDIYGIVLGVLAAVAVLGLIPLWLSVYFTFTR